MLKNEIDPLLNAINRLESILEKFSKNEAPSEWLDVSETCIKLKISPRTLQNYRDKGLLPYSQIGAKIYFHQKDLEDFIMKHRVDAGNFKTVLIKKGQSHDLR